MSSIISKSCGRMKSQKISPAISGKKSSNESSLFDTTFSDLHYSAFSKAFAASSALDSSSFDDTFATAHSHLSVDHDEFGVSKSLCSSTPIKFGTSTSARPVVVSQKICSAPSTSKLSPIVNAELSKSKSAKKLLAELEADRRLTVEAVMKERIANFLKAEKLIQLENLKETVDDAAIAKKILAEQKILDDVEEQMCRNKAKWEAEVTQNILKNEQRVQERNQKVKEAVEEARLKSEAILRKRKLLDQFLDLQKRYRNEYTAMLETMRACNEDVILAEVIDSYAKDLKTCGQVFETLFKRCKQGEITESDIQSMAQLAGAVKASHSRLLEHVKEVTEAAAAKKKSDDERHAAELSEKEAQAAEAQAQQLVNQEQVQSSQHEAEDLSDCFDSMSLQKYSELKHFAANFETNLSSFLADDTTKSFRFACKKAVTIPVNSISPINAAHLADKYQKLYNLLSGQRIELRDVALSASQHPMGVAYCKLLLAKEFVKQGDCTVSRRPDSAFSIAAVLGTLWVDFPDFGHLVLAFFQQKCPYLAPVFLPQLEGQTDKDYYRSLGYTYNDAGEVEKQASFLKRMSGVMRLYAAVLVSKPRGGNKTNPLGMTEAWRWLAAILDLQPRPDICATLLHDFLDVAGHQLSAVYGSQFKKVLAYICQEYYPKLEKVTPPSSLGPMVRLEEFLQKVVKGGTVNPPEGVLPPNFW